MTWPQEPTPQLLEVEDLVTSFSTERGRLRAVDGVSFSLGRGRTLGIVGESGSGKSVLARTIMGILARSAKIERGCVRFEGQDQRELSKRQRRRIWGRDVAMVFQDPLSSLNPVVPISRQLTEGLRAHHGLDRSAARKHAVELLKQVGISEPERRMDAYPHELSGGMRQRVAIAIAIACSPRLLLADEPTTALDVTIQRQILDLLARLQAETGMAMILISHDLGVVAQRTDDIAVMYAGRIVEWASARDLFSSPRHPYTASLLASIPRIEEPSGTPLSSIPGSPPDMARVGAGCAFASRCQFAQDRCLDETPSETWLSEGHAHRCFFPLSDLASPQQPISRAGDSGSPIEGPGTTDFRRAENGW